MMSMCPHVIDALRWVPSLQHRITRPGIVCSHDTATNVACCVQLPCIAVQHCAVRALQVVKMRKSMLYCCSVSGSHAIKLWLCSVHSSLYAAQPWLTEVLHDNLDLWSVECGCLIVCMPIDGMAHCSGRGPPADLVVGACCRFLLEAEVSSVAAHLQTSASPLLVRSLATQSKPT